jgi:hypothetical protein
MAVRSRLRFLSEKPRICVRFSSVSLEAKTCLSVNRKSWRQIGSFRPRAVKVPENAALAAHFLPLAR